MRAICGNRRLCACAMHENQHYTRMSNKHFIREWRRHRGLTLEQLGERIGASAAAVSRIERGEQRYNQEVLEEMAKELDCTPSDLISRSPATPDIAGLLDDLTGNDREALLTFVDQFARRAKTLKRDLEAERAALGSMLYEGDSLVRACMRHVTLSAFSLPLHQEIYAALLRRVAQDQLIDLVEVDASLRGEPEYAGAGGLAYLVDLTDRAPPRPEGEAAIGKVMDFWIRRVLAGAAEHEH